MCIKCQVVGFTHSVDKQEPYRNSPDDSKLSAISLLDRTSKTLYVYYIEVMSKKFSKGSHVSISTLHFVVVIIHKLVLTVFDIYTKCEVCSFTHSKDSLQSRFLGDHSR